MRVNLGFGATQAQRVRLQTSLNGPLDDTNSGNSHTAIHAGCNGKARLQPPSRTHAKSYVLAMRKLQHRHGMWHSQCTEEAWRSSPSSNDLLESNAPLPSAPASDPGRGNLGAYYGANGCGGEFLGRGMGGGDDRPDDFHRQLLSEENLAACPAHEHPRCSRWLRPPLGAISPRDGNRGKGGPTAAGG